MKLEKDFIERLSYEDLKNYDIIDIGEELDRIAKIYKVIKVNPREDDIHPILSTGIIKIDGSYLFFNIVDDDKVEFILFKSKSKAFYMLVNIKIEENLLEAISGKPITAVLERKTFDKTLSDSDIDKLYFFYISEYLVPMTVLSTISDLVEVEEVERLPRNKKEQKEYNTAKYINKQPIKLTKKRYKIKNLSDVEIESVKRNYEFSFGVRGHKRHYEEKTVVCKNGTVRHYKEKIVDIKPFTKGNGDYKSKKYKL